MDALTTLLIGGTAALGFVALGLGGFVLGTHADGTPRRREEGRSGRRLVVASVP